MVYTPAELPIGVFDSGVGGLTVLAALRQALPEESFIYLGDTARLPYGTKSAQTVERYARQAAQVLVDRGVKLLVIACNTASAVAVESLQRHFRPLPVLGVVEPGAAAAVAASASGTIIVTGTEGTIAGGAYERAIRRHLPTATVIGRACPIFVALAEEGWTDGEVPRLAAQRYLEPVRAAHPDADCLVLGCTHFPVLAATVQPAVGPSVAIVDSARTTAHAVIERLDAAGLRRHRAAPAGGADLTLLATDDPDRFARVGASFLGLPLESASVELVDL